MTIALPGSHGTRRSVVGVGQQHHVAVAGLPARHRVAVDGVHVDVDREQVIAGLGAVRKDLFFEQPGRHPLADEPPLRIGEGHDHGVDLAGRDRDFSSAALRFPGMCSSSVCVRSGRSPVARHPTVTRNFAPKVDKSHQ